MAASIRYKIDIIVCPMEMRKYPRWINFENYGMGLGTLFLPALIKALRKRAKGKRKDLVLFNKLVGSCIDAWSNHGRKDVNINDG